MLTRWIDDLRLYVLFDSISVPSGRWKGSNERLCAMTPRLRLKRSPPQVGLEPGTARSVFIRSKSSNIGMMHCFSRINICRASRKLSYHKAAMPRVQTFFRGTRQVLRHWNNHAWSIFLHLAHLSHWAHRWAYNIARHPPAFRRLSVYIFKHLLHWNHCLESNN